MMFLQIEQACTNLQEYLNMMLLQIEQACTNLREYLNIDAFTNRTGLY